MTGPIQICCILESEDDGSHNGSTEIPLLWMISSIIYVTKGEAWVDSEPYQGLVLKTIATITDEEGENEG